MNTPHTTSPEEHRAREAAFEHGHEHGHGHEHHRGHEHHHAHHHGAGHAHEHHRAHGPDGQFIHQIAETIGDNARATTIFATPVERDGVTVIPVAKARWGFGGGTGRQKEGEEGAGGGGGLLVAPVGYIELSKGKSRYRPIVNPMPMFPMLLAAGVIAWIITRRLMRE